MKRTITTISLAMVLGLAILFTTGCAGLLLTPTQEMAVKKLARIAGITLALESPTEIDKALSYIEYMEGLEDGNIKDAAMAVAIEYVYTKFGKTNKTVILVAEVVDLLKIAIPEGAIDGISPEFDMKLLNMALAGFKEGLILAQ